MRYLNAIPLPFVRIVPMSCISLAEIFPTRSVLIDAFPRSRLVRCVRIVPMWCDLLSNGEVHPLAGLRRLFELYLVRRFGGCCTTEAVWVLRVHNYRLWWQVILISHEFWSTFWWLPSARNALLRWKFRIFISYLLHSNAWSFTTDL